LNPIILIFLCSLAIPTYFLRLMADARRLRQSVPGRPVTSGGNAPFLQPDL
jgi:hypothetical protein